MSAEAFADLSGLESLIQSQEEGIEIEILNEKGEPIGLKIGFVGPDSDRMQKAMRDVAAEFAKKAAERSSLDAATDDSDDRMIAILAKSTTHWSPNPKIGGQVIPFSEENVRNLYAKFRIIRDQVEVRAVRRSSFTKS
ncbi:conserved hypothetical protein [Rhizobium leguminosarum bv. trifolii WSM2304]|uniref:Uncharacterized protein n=1 Tax=Rhizobium leguminosarum bv. trifolii (strain WSM2304) TaxID=395492 RepID=A0ABF7QPE8_RHILW|nr:hypothetical protein [Rhizobium leguminosarum]ACI55690.1 conserved hypothetical protein [Rhizobium leguminosarum bv. trifolii WSM2304]